MSGPGSRSSTDRLVATRLAGGVWEGLLHGFTEEPRVLATHGGQELPGVTVAAGNGGWVVRVPVPAETLAEGVQTYLVADAATGEVLGSFALVAGEALSLDLRAEIDLLRAELDMLKRAFRRHCLEAGA